ncbi:hypothetical protein SAMN05421693_11647 [Ectothiorhodospira magna]|uniref:Uncharacterized protein n=1 Tax=Ectothiorhodospira magna TaxID=867345 RepID=A0A1H9D858_9GAMM|nr:hypothetical protein [Ectothiorhodospira magna]SEQ09043.1 hypothetical protein SAMN05421693_11647 [Ectothiorhodospira magna]
MTNDILNGMTSAEIYALARQREAQENEQAEQACREKLETLKAQRKDLIARQTAELAAIDRDIKALGGRVPPGRKSPAGEGRNGDEGDAGQSASGVGLSKMVLDLIHERGEMTTKALRQELQSQGVETRHISQTLAYLKRNNRLRNISRGVYGPL